jgi:hypothetical protein
VSHPFYPIWHRILKLVKRALQLKFQNAPPISAADPSLLPIVDLPTSCRARPCPKIWVEIRRATLPRDRDRCWLCGEEWSSRSGWGRDRRGRCGDGAVAGLGAAEGNPCGLAPRLRADESRVVPIVLVFFSGLMRRHFFPPVLGQTGCKFIGLTGHPNM